MAELERVIFVQLDGGLSLCLEIARQSQTEFTVEHVSVAVADADGCLFSINIDEAVRALGIADKIKQMAQVAMDDEDTTPTRH